jgi:hypothetical protein
MNYYKVIKVLKKEIKTPLGFLALVVSIVGGILLSLILKEAKRFNLTILIVSCVLLIFVACLMTLYFLYSPSTLDVKKEIKPPSGRNYDLFISVPMAAFDVENEFELFHKTTLDIVHEIKKNCKFKNIFYAGQEIKSPIDFESEDSSIVEDYDACFRSKYFMLIYPQKIATSALIELGWAMAHKKPIIIFVKNRKDLPFLVKNGDSVFSNLRIYNYKTSLDIINMFRVNGNKIFEQLVEIKKSRPSY